MTTEDRAKEWWQIERSTKSKMLSRLFGGFCSLWIAMPKWMSMYTVKAIARAHRCRSIVHVEYSHNTTLFNHLWCLIIQSVRMCTFLYLLRPVSSSFLLFNRLVDRNNNNLIIPFLIDKQVDVEVSDAQHINEKWALAARYKVDCGALCSAHFFGASNANG